MNDIPEQNTYNKSTEYAIKLDYPVLLSTIRASSIQWEKETFRWHDEILIFYVCSGTLSLQTAEKKISVQEQEALFLNQNTLYRFLEDTTSSCVADLFIFDPTFLFGISNTYLNAKYLAPIVSAKNYPFVLFQHSEKWHSHCLRSIQELITCNQKKFYGYELQTKGILCNFWMSLLHHLSLDSATLPKYQPVAQHSRIHNALLYIQQHYTEPVTLDEIADSIHVSKSECCRSFKKALQMTPFEYLMKYRIYVATIKITSNDPVASNISSLAASVGFNNTRDRKSVV